MESSPGLSLSLPSFGNFSRPREGDLFKKRAKDYDQFFYGHGKILLTGEYFILEGAKGLALPTKFGQSMGVRYEKSYDPKLTWRSYDYLGQKWLEATFEFWHFNILQENPPQEVLQLQRTLRECRWQNKHFLRDSQNIIVETNLGFDRQWGLGSSSTFLYNMAQWAYISPFELAKKTFGGSGYDIACASSDGPIIYQLIDHDSNWSSLDYNPPFSHKLFFVYLGRKQDTRESVLNFQKRKVRDRGMIEMISTMTEEIAHCKDWKLFNDLIGRHEEVIGKCIGATPLKREAFRDFPGEMKSLGAWGGDFSLISTDLPLEEIQKYFKKHDLDIIIPFKDMVLEDPYALHTSGDFEREDSQGVKEWEDGESGKSEKKRRDESLKDVDTDGEYFIH